MSFHSADLRANFEHGFNQFQLDVLGKCHFLKTEVSFKKTEPSGLNGNLPCVSMALSSCRTGSLYLCLLMLIFLNSCFVECSSIGLVWCFHNEIGTMRFSRAIAEVHSTLLRAPYQRCVPPWFSSGLRCCLPSFSTIFPLELISN